MTSGVYAIVHKESRMAYVGSSADIELRWAKHRSNLQHGYGPDRLMIEAWQVGGTQAFDFLILEEVPADDDALEEAERRWFAQYAERLCNHDKVAQRRRPAMREMEWKIRITGGKLTDYQQRQLARARRPPEGAEEGEEGSWQSRSASD